MTAETILTKIFSFETIIKAILTIVDSLAKTNFVLWWGIAKKVVLSVEDAAHSSASLTDDGKPTGAEKRQAALELLKEQIPTHEGWLLLMIQLAWAFFQKTGWEQKS